MKQLNFILGLFALVGLLLTGCENNGEILQPLKTNGEQSLQKRDFTDTHSVISSGAIYTMTNSSDGNEVMVFDRTSTGQLKYSGSYPTKGQGIGEEIDPLASQGSIVLSRSYIPEDLWIGSDHKSSLESNRWLFVVNAGSNNISVFAATANGLELRDIVSSGDGIPVSLTYHNSLLYVLNRGNRRSGDIAIRMGNINGFKVGKNGQLEEISGSLQFLSGYGQTEAAQIKFTPDGKMLVVTEKETDVIDIYMVGDDGLTSEAVTYSSAGSTPFGFDFDHRGGLVVAEAFENAPNQGAVSLYELGSDGDLQLVSTSVPTYQSGSSRVVVTWNGKYAYIANTHSGTISGFGITASGRLKPINEKTIVAQVGEDSYPIDMALSEDDRFLYILDPGVGTIYAFKVENDGKLKPLFADANSNIHLSGLPSVQGLAAY